MIPVRSKDGLFLVIKYRCEGGRENEALEGGTFEDGLEDVELSRDEGSIIVLEGGT